MNKSFLFLIALLFTFQVKAQPADCVLKQPLVGINFGTGNIQDLNSSALENYEPVSYYCPTDGHYTFTPYTSKCFRDDWFTLEEDHTPGDVAGNMMLVNASHRGGAFLSTTINGLKGNTTYEFAAWMMNLCKITKKCPFPLLPVIIVRLETVAGKLVGQFRTGELVRRQSPQWTQHKAYFTTPASPTPLILTMIDISPGGCGNDFALDDITFRECVKPVVKITTPPKPIVQPKKVQKAPPLLVKKAISRPAKKQAEIIPIVKPKKEVAAQTVPVVKPQPSALPVLPPHLTTRSSPLVKRIETEMGEIRIDLYDNGDIDGDTVTIYHNNTMLFANVGLTQKPLTFKILVDYNHPHHELVMVANNLGSIPPNTSLMIVTAGGRRHEVFISSTEQRNAKVVFDLKDNR
ncbi:hypothetical protein [Segetibacter aerophilus]|uniref:CBM-cenC domain-containing protein n=1 Tax=Segetibacter aerophilus TaxID=670293 RepID=A0A512BFY3_9BACT|nr:hypothetical protein [Segetibacter aerophilus]GEO10880.1 hypothetical protein SAE01_33760 [Segetibacter aerophilus]